MAVKHYIQHYMFSDPNGGHLTQAVTYLQTAAFRLKHIQVSSFTYSCILCMQLVYSSNYRNYILKHLVWNSQQDSI